MDPPSKAALYDGGNHIQEEGMVGGEEREKIRRAYYIEKKGIKRIAREFGHGRKVVRKAIKESGIPVYQRRQPVSLPVLGPYLPIIQQWLADDGVFFPSPPKGVIRTSYLLKTPYFLGVLYSNNFLEHFISKIF